MDSTDPKAASSADSKAIDDSNTTSRTLTNTEIMAKIASESKKTKAEPDLANQLGEILRKINKMPADFSKEIDTKLASFSSAQKPTQASFLTDSDLEVPSYVTKAEYAAEKAQSARSSLQNEQRNSFGDAMDMFGELNQKGEDFDEEFYNKTNDFYVSKFQNDPEGPMLAAKLAAVELGKIEKLAKSNFLNDERRRHRILEQGGLGRSKAAAEEPASTLNKDRLQRLFGIDPAKVEARIKADPARYGTPKKGKN